MIDDVLRLASGVVVTGFPTPALDARLRERLQQLPFAGFILFARNVESLAGVRALTDQLRAFSDPPPLIAIDQEGGRVARVRDGVEPLPPMMALGATRDARRARAAGEQLAFDLRRAGVTHDFAPVVDLALDAQNSVIGARAFGESPQLVIDLARAFVQGMSDAGMGATIKHFPGHGATAVDSHLALPVLDADAATMRLRDLSPFQALCGVVPAIMAAHVVARGFDGAVPASLSPALLTGVLREEWGFDGVCFTDCMQMDAIARGVGTVEGVAAAIAAGADCAIVSHDVDLACAAAVHLAREVNAGRIPRTRLEEAHARVTRLRAAAPSPLPLDAVAPHSGVGRAIARDAVTLVRGIAHADATGSIAVSFEGATTEGAQGALEVRFSLAREAPALAEIVLSLDPAEEDIAALLDDVARSRRRPIALVRRLASNPQQLHAVRCLVERFPDTLLVAVREPYDCALVPAARHVLATYGDMPVCLQGLCDVIFGDGDAKGTLPVTLG